MRSPPTIDDGVRQRLAARFGAEVGAWFDELPAVLSALAVRWQVDFDSLIPRGNMSVVIRCRLTNGRPAVLKVSPDRTRLANEAAALNRWTTVHTPSVLAVDESAGAVLIEAIEPGTPLVDSPTYPDMESVAELLTSLHATGVPDPSYPPLAQHVAYLFNSGTKPYKRRPELVDVVPPELYERGRQLATRLVERVSPTGLLHGDLTPNNILDGGNQRGLVASDPAPCLGEDLAFDAIDLLLWQADDVDIIAAPAEELAPAIDVDARRLLDWCTAFEVSAGSGLGLSIGAAAPDEFYDAYTFNVESRSVWARARSRFLQHRLAVAGLLILGVLFSAGLFASHFAPYGYLEINPGALSQAPSWDHPFGTDQLGRDYFSRVLHGIGTEARIAMLVAVFGTFVGTLVGVGAGYFGGAVGELLMRLTDLLLTLPPLVVVFVAAVYLHVTTTFTISILLACLLWMPIARVVRGTSLSLREREYVEAARAMGASDFRIIARHILPNAVGPIAVAATVMTAGAIVLETTLSYLGFGISKFAREDKRIPSLGDVMAEANVEGLFHWWGLFFPGLVLVLIVMSVYFIGDGLRDALDPSERRWVAPRRRRRDMKPPG